MKNKVAIIFGGKSAEHEVSLNSAENIIKATNKTLFDMVLIGVDKNGIWHFNSEYKSDLAEISLNRFFSGSTEIILETKGNKTFIIDAKNKEALEFFDVAFPIIHGTFGEDGTLQGYFKTLNIPFVGADILASAICMDKEITKRILRDAQIPVANFIPVNNTEQDKCPFEQAVAELGLPLFVKPCNAGSSVGVSKVTDKVTFTEAIKSAFQHDKKILIEEAVMGKEVECAILGNEKPIASVVGEIIPQRDFYSYEAKYKDAHGAKMKIPAEIPVEIADSIRNTALNAYRLTCCEGMARVDFFLSNDNTFVLNEINTLPGFTKISMYPKLWEYSGISYSHLITKLIELAIEKHKRDGGDIYSSKKF